MTLQSLIRRGTLVLLLLCACDHGNLCDEGVPAGPGQCKPAPAAVKDAGEPADAGGKEVDAGAPAEKSLGTDCTADGDCKKDAPFCAKQPGQAKGYCTIRDCSTSDDKCPSGYTCFNLGIASVPAFCLKS